jgi:pyruvate kinase
MATVGPAWDRDGVPERIADLAIPRIRLRYNLAQGTLEFHSRMMARARSAFGKDVIISTDIGGRKARIDKGQEKLVLITGSKIKVSYGDRYSAPYIRFNNQVIIEAGRVGDQPIIGDTEVRLEILQKIPEGWECLVVKGGTVIANKGVLVRGMEYENLPLPLVPECDVEGYDFSAAERVHTVYASYVSSLKQAREYERVAREQRFEGLLGIKGELLYEVQHCYRELIDHSDAFMFARGDGTVSVGVAKVLTLQPEMAEYAAKKVKVFVLGTGVAGGLENDLELTVMDGASIVLCADDLLSNPGGEQFLMLSGEASVPKDKVACPVVTIDSVWGMMVVAYQRRCRLLNRVQH